MITTLCASINGIIQKTVLRKATTDPIAFAIYFQLLAGLVALPFAIFAVHTPQFNLVIIGMLIANSMLYAFVNILGFLALKAIELSQSAILSSVSSLWILIGGVLFFNETINFKKVLGILLIILGIIVVFFHKKRMQPFSLPHIFILLSTIFIAIGGLLDKYLIDYFEISSYQFITYFLQAIFTALLVPQVIKDIQPLIKFNMHNLMIIVAACIINLGVFSYFFALKQGGEISNISPILQTSTIITIILSSLLLKERDNLLKKILAAAIIFIGLIFLKGS
jgi:transporter family protein